MAVNRASVVDQQFVDAVSALPAHEVRTDLDSPVRAGAVLTARQALELFESMASSRHLDLASRQLKARGESFYTIGGSGHEGNACVAGALRPTDPAFLHYRSGAFFVQRARQVPGTTPLLDVLLGCAASSDEPIAGGRHKVFGSVPLNIPPQTSTIASHLPKAVGAAMTVDRMKRLELPSDIPDDSVVVCTFGDASSNHSTSAGAINAACWASFQNIPVPLVFVCEDNGRGISVTTPAGWIAANYRDRPGLHYVHGDGLDLPDAWRAATEAVEHARTTRRPVFLHLSLVRMLGHAGSDVEQLYRTAADIRETEAKDPVLAAARLLVEEGWRTPDQILALYEELRSRIGSLAEEVTRRPKITTAEQVVEPLAPWDDDAVRAHLGRADEDARRAFWGARLPEDDRPRHLAMQLNRALGDALACYPEMLIFGEDVARKGGVYHVTADLSKKAGVGRVFNTLLDEQAILGLAIGAGQLGCLPVPEIQYLAYLHNAEDQIRGEAASMQFFSQGQFKNPMVVRIASYAYQKGFGGHFHNDNSIAVLRDIPGLVIASPSRGDDAVGMLRTCLAAARTQGSVVAFLEPIALYMTKDLHEDGDGLWTTEYDPDHTVEVGTGRTWGDGTDLCIVSWANGAWMGQRVAKRLEQQGISSRVLDLRWLSPLPIDDLVREAQACGRVLIVDECRETGSLSEALVTHLVEAGFDGPIARVTGIDTFIPLGAAANLVLVQEPDIEAAAIELVNR
ncbi:MAG: MFS transporter [Proteobacteria bacterium]|nr:MFS transporter [Pseudomonadota bacterium]MCP4920377.1 MFS transporter [Pseudomonadota bacterium]